MKRENGNRRVARVDDLAIVEYCTDAVCARVRMNAVVGGNPADNYVPMSTATTTARCRVLRAALRHERTRRASAVTFHLRRARWKCVRRALRRTTRSAWMLVGA